jgi:flagellar basal body rod protein FlgG
VHQYALEESNASGIHEMISMIAIQRSFENSARMLQTIKESYQRLTRPF